MRGDLGPLTVWMTPDTIRDKHESEEEWKQLYAAVHPASPSPSPSLTLALALALALTRRALSTPPPRRNSATLSRNCRHTHRDANR